MLAVGSFAVLADDAQWKNRGPLLGTAALLALSLACNAIMLSAVRLCGECKWAEALRYLCRCVWLLEGTRPETVGNKARWLKVLVLRHFWSFTEMFHVAVDQEAM